MEEMKVQSGKIEGGKVRGATRILILTKWGCYVNRCPRRGEKKKKGNLRSQIEQKQEGLPAEKGKSLKMGGN